VSSAFDEAFDFNVFDLDVTTADVELEDEATTAIAITDSAVTACDVSDVLVTEVE
jgi:hypothetical protein